MTCADSGRWTKCESMYFVTANLQRSILRYELLNWDDWCLLYSPTFLAYPHVCVLLNMFVLQNDVVALVEIHFVNVTNLNKLYPDILNCIGYLKTQSTMLQFDIHSSFNFRLLPCLWCCENSLLPLSGREEALKQYEWLVRFPSTRQVAALL